MVRYKVRLRTDFRDLGTAIVNKSADASTDPTIRAYPILEECYFDSLFKVESINTKTGEVKWVLGYKDILELAPFGELAALKDAVNVAKPSQIKNISYSLIKDLDVKNVSPQTAKKIGLTVGERANYTRDGITYSITRLENVNRNMVQRDKQSKRPKNLVLGNSRYEISKVSPKAMSLYDIAHSVNNVQAKLFARGADTIPQIVKKMYDAGIQYDFKFSTIQNNYKKLYSNANIQSDRTTGLTTYSSKEMSKFIEQHLGLLLSDLSIASPQQINYAITQQRNIGRALDYL